MSTKLSALTPAVLADLDADTLIYAVLDPAGTAESRAVALATLDQWLELTIGAGIVQTIVAGANVTVDATDPANPIVSSTGGGGSGDALTTDVTQVAHGFDVGDLVYLTGANTYALAQADDDLAAEVVGIVSAVAGANDFTFTHRGLVTGLSGLTAATVYFLSDATPGLLTATEPTTAGNVSKPVLVAVSTTAGLFLNYRGNVVGVSSGFVESVVGGDDVVVDATDPANPVVGVVPDSFLRLPTVAPTSAAQILGLSDDDPLTTDWIDPPAGGSFGGCRLTNSADQAIAALTVQAVSFDTENIDVGGFHAAGQPTRITNTTGATIRLIVGAAAQLNAARVWLAWFRVNGTTDIPGGGRAEAANASITLPPTLIELANNSYVEFIISNQDVSNTLSVRGGGGNGTAVSFWAAVV